jgi:uncharacterized protein
MNATALDRAADIALRCLGFANLALVAAFLVTLLTIAPARAEAACTGTDMLAELERTDPEALAAIRAEADATVNGEGLLWRIERQGVDPSWLFGTMHVTDPRVLELGPEARAALDGSATVVIETVEILDPAAMTSAMLAKPELTMFTDGTTLRSLIDPEDLAMVEAALSGRGMPLATLNAMKPWIVSAIAAMPACELARKAAGEPVLDQKLALDAQADGKGLGGLETVADQLGAMASLPLDLHVEGLVATLRIADRVDDVMETMIAIYLDGDTGLFWPFFRATLPEAGTAEDAGYADFEAVMVTARNHGMARNSKPFIDAGGAFIAVGALHLPGEEGLVELLRRDGYSVERAD